MTFSIAPDLIERQLARIMSSPAFAGSPRMSRFLEFAVRETMQGNAGDLKEIVIGASVFDRDADYDPRLDPIVRVEARRLRAKLKSYYDEIGREDDIIIELPRGSYAPTFRRRSEQRLIRPDAVPRRSASMAILPFRNLHAGDDAEYFGDGLTEELINALTRAPRLRVVAWNSAARFRNQEADLYAISRQLSVDYILRGSIRKTGERLRIAAQLVDGISGQYIWSETYDRQVHDVFAIQEQIACAIAGSLELQFPDGPAPKPARRENVDIWKLCLQGRFHARDRSPDGLRRSVMCFEKAVALSTESASAWAGLADSYTLLAEYELAHPSEAVPKAKAAARKALDLDPLSAEAHASLGLILCAYDRDWGESSRMFELAVELNPGYANARFWYGCDNLAIRGKFAEAREQIEAAIELDPLSNIILEGRPFLHTLERNYDPAIRECEAMLRIDPSFYKAWAAMGRALIQLGNYLDAIEVLAKCASLAGELPIVLGALGQAYGLSGDAAGARAVLDKLRTRAQTRPVRSACFAIVHLGLGETEQALAHIERAIEAGESRIATLGVHPVWDPLRPDPRFKELLKRTGLLTAALYR